MEPGYIWVYNGKQFIKPTDVIKSTRRLTSFCVTYGIRNALLKSQGGWYWLGLDGRLGLVNRCLGNITFEEIYNLNQKEKHGKQDNL
jgi:hypothetical protein